MGLKDIEVSQLKSYDKNARKHSEHQIKLIAESIQKFGFLDPVEIDENYMILSGHGRVEAAQLVGLEKIPCLIHENLSDTDKKAYILAANRIQLESEWDTDILRGEMRELLNTDVNLLNLGFGSLEIDALLYTQNNTTTDEDEIPEVEETFVEPGQIYQLGKHRLICADITDIDSLSILMGKEKADLILTDPPYNVAYEGNKKKRKKIENDEMKDDDFEAFLKDSFAAYYNFSKDNASFYIFHPSSQQHIFRSALLANDFVVNQQLIWVKNHFSLNRSRFKNKHEPFYFGHKKNQPPKFYTKNKESTVWEVGKLARSALHPTMKPVSLLERALAYSSNTKDLIIDFFGGSGSTLIACEKMARRCYTCELDPHYASVIIKRWENYTDKKAELIDDPN